jgi:hypothetical protein
MMGLSLLDIFTITTTSILKNQTRILQFKAANLSSRPLNPPKRRPRSISHQNQPPPPQCIRTRSRNFSLSTPSSLQTLRNSYPMPITTLHKRRTVYISKSTPTNGFFLVGIGGFLEKKFGIAMVRVRVEG